MFDFCVNAVWDGTTSSVIDEAVSMRLEWEDGGEFLVWRVDAPFHGDEFPVTKNHALDDGDPNPALAMSVWELWEYEVAEIFIVGKDSEYLEVELGPGGHYLALTLKGPRKTILRKELPLDNVVATRDGLRWSGNVRIPKSYLPAPIAGERAHYMVNGYAIHGQGACRRYLVATPLATSEPDFHRISNFKLKFPAAQQTSSAATVEEALRVTETPNSITRAMGDATDPEHIVRIVRRVDSQIFCGYDDYSSIFDPEICQHMERSAAMIADVLRCYAKGSENAQRLPRVAFGGSGTSGRIAVLVARHFNQALAKMIGIDSSDCFHALISGGDAAFLLSDELPEDDPHLGRSDLEACLGGVGGLYVGITCGMSAPYVAGQLDYVLSRSSEVPKLGATLIGFNPVTLARERPIEKWTGDGATPSATGAKTFRDVAQQLHNRSRVGSGAPFAVINPVIGPEAVTGSTRMKGGSATKIILDAIVAKAFQLVFNASSAPTPIQRFTAQYERACRATYMHNERLGKVTRLAATALQRGGHVYYIGASSAGAAGIIDASEMPDTYGSPFDEFRGFLYGGWEQLKLDSKLRSVGALYCISAKDFEADVLPKMSCADVVVGLDVQSDDSLTDTSSPPHHAHMLSMLERAAGKGSSVAFLGATGTGHCLENFIKLIESSIPECVAVLVRLDKGCNIHDFGKGCYLPKYGAEVEQSCLKWMLNAVSTGAQVLCGKVYGNRMINTSPVNNKLYYRCIFMIQDLCNVSRDTAELCLLRSVHDVEHVSKRIRNAPISHHVIASTPTSSQLHDESKLMPVAILIACAHRDGRAMTVEQARSALKGDPRVAAHINQRTAN